MNPIYGILLLILSYLIGNLDFGYLIVRAVKGVDIRDYGSGNAGMTNVLRTMGGKLAAWVFIGDSLKGVLCVLVPRLLGFSEWWVVGSAIAVVCGHNWPIFLHFRGGKGVATSIGVFVAFDPLCAIFGLLVGLVLLFSVKYMSIASMSGLCVMPFVVLIIRGTKNIPELVLAIFLAVCVVFQHRTNIKRLLNGTESKMNFSKKKTS